MTLRSAAHTDIGHVRSENEDSLLCDDALQLYGVADGIGGLPGGAQASQTAILTLTGWFQRRTTHRVYDYSGCLVEVNREVHDLGHILSPLHGIGTTLTAAHFTGDKIVVMHVGDTTLYRLRAGELDALTIEHNLGNEIQQRLARGEIVAHYGENKAALTRCIGQPPPLDPDIHTHDVQPGDRYLFCSDGITRCIFGPELSRALAEESAPASLVQRLVARANELGGLDNATAVAVFLD